MHPIIRRQINPHGSGARRVSIRLGGFGYPYYGYPWAYGYPYGYPTAPAVQERVVCERIPGNMECPNGTVVNLNDDGTKTCCPPTTSQAVQTPAYPPYYGYGYPGYRIYAGYPWRRWW